VPAADEVHLWRASSDVTGDELVHLASTLTVAELERSVRFRFDRDRARFVAARGQLRALLGRYLDTRPSEITLTKGRYGKPQLDAGRGWLRFNLSHSDGVAVFAVALDREVGIDLERIRVDFPIEDIARHNYSPRERADLALLPEADRCGAAFGCWTRKEAYLKAVGTGLALPLDAIEVGVEHGAPVRLLDSDGEGCWSIHAFDAGPGYAAAVAVEGRPGKVPIAARSL
jgi:4'-phosphopantetheinyl transferase